MTSCAGKSTVVVLSTECWLPSEAWDPRPRNESAGPQDGTYSSPMGRGPWSLHLNRARRGRDLRKAVLAKQTQFEPTQCTKCSILDHKPVSGNMNRNISLCLWRKLQLQTLTEQRSCWQAPCSVRIHLRCRQPLY
jgi:hypothetical protein